VNLSKSGTKIQTGLEMHVSRELPKAFTVTRADMTELSQTAHLIYFPHIRLATPSLTTQETHNQSYLELI